MNRALIFVALLSLAGCKHSAGTKPSSTSSSSSSSSSTTQMTAVAPVRTIELLPETPEQPTEEIKERRPDIEVDTHDFDRTPHVVATGDTQSLQLLGQRALLAGNQAGTDGFSVDNFLLFEVLSPAGQVTSRFVVGHAEGVLVNDQRLDNVGRDSFNFDPNEIDITSHLPESGPFKLRVSALDYGGVGRVSNVWLILSTQKRGSSEDDLRDR
jgi:hypothetical protein